MQRPIIEKIEPIGEKFNVHFEAVNGKPDVVPLDRDELIQLKADMVGHKGSEDDIHHIEVALLQPGVQ